MMKMKAFVSVLFLIFLGASALPAQAQRIELIFQSDQLIKGGRAALQAGNHDRAIYYFEEALKRRNLSRIDLIEVHNSLCILYIYVDKFDSAIDQCKASLEVQSNRWETHNNLGTVYMVMGNYEEAIQSFERGLKMKPSSTILQFNLDLAKRKLRQGPMTEQSG